ncbi:MAG: aspartate kinase [Bacteroidales bacterium]|jgi:aspartate kinase|nr:aspartate kinase [Bacteroidales bacterium]
MKVFKFGGASVKNAEGIKNVADIIRKQMDTELILVVSAMGKMTNRLEELLYAALHHLPEREKLFTAIRDDHFAVLKDLFGSSKRKISNEMDYRFNMLHQYMDSMTGENYDYEYDQIVSYGEFLSSLMVFHYLVSVGLPVHWIDARFLIRTDNTYREARLNWDVTTNSINKIVRHAFEQTDKRIVLTQGFIGGTKDAQTTTLGREGSDFSAAILAFALDAQSVTIWKDVDGLLNADPHLFSDTVKLDKVSYREAIELAYYGASIIHPKTLQPLQNKKIPLYVKSFIHPDEAGSAIYDYEMKEFVPCYIIKQDQVLISISPKDFSFIAEDNLSFIFGLVASFGIKINLMQNSEISFSICVDNRPNLNVLIEKLQTEFFVKYNFDMELLTIRHYDRPHIDKLTKGRTLLLEQKNRTTVQYVMS